MESAAKAFCSTRNTVTPSSRLSLVMISNTWSTSTGASPIDGSSRSKSFGRLIRARPMASICCWPPESPPARVPPPFLQHREEVVDPGKIRRDLRVLAQVGAEPEIVLDGKRGEDLPPFRHLGDAGGDARMRACPRDVASLEGEAAAAHRLDAGEGAQQCRLAGAVAADKGDDLAGIDPGARRRAGLRSARRRSAVGRREAADQSSARLASRVPWVPR